MRQRGWDWGLVTGVWVSSGSFGCISFPQSQFSELLTTDIPFSRIDITPRDNLQQFPLCDGVICWQSDDVNHAWTVLLVDCHHHFPTVLELMLVCYPRSIPCLCKITLANSAANTNTAGAPRSCDCAQVVPLILLQCHGFSDWNFGRPSPGCVSSFKHPQLTH